MFRRKSCYLSFVLILLTDFTSAQDKSADVNDAVFNFTVTNKNDKPRQGELIILKSKKTGKTFEGRTETNGKCSVIIPSSDSYVIFYKLFADTVKYREIEVPGGDHRVTYTLNLKYNSPKTYTLKNVFFETGLATLKKESYPALNELVEALKSKTTLVIEIAGHTDNVGTEESNQELSQDRAESVRDYLIKHGIDPGRVVAKGYGESQPVASNDTPQDRQKNRRTEVRIISE